ncbi:MAG: SpoVT-AbrB protein [Candidatus Poribacteria bacterium]|nr:SpoVT-AbrB protein [Candidatus Poribacteria bacterium]
MSVVKIGPKHQITIPKEVFNQLHLEIGDFLDVVVSEERIIIIPKELTTKVTVPTLNKDEQKALTQIKKKILKIQMDHIHSKGLTDIEAEIAAKVGLIDTEQMWWWKEEWQEGEREAENNIVKGEVSEAFTNVEDVISYLSKR